jgi:lysophospholipase L1-like esterase
MRKGQTMKWRATLLNAATLGVALMVCLILMEIGLRVFLGSDFFYPYYPHSVSYNYPSEEITPGVSGVSRFTTNSFGARGRELNGREQLKILTVGGSTTACTVLDDSKTWPAVLERLLGELMGDKELVWVANSGIDGLFSHHHLMHAKYYLPGLPHIDYVIVYAGMNDMGYWFHHKDFDPNYLSKPEHWNTRVGESFRWSAYTPSDLPIYQRLAIWRTASRVKNAYFSKYNAEVGDRNGAFIQDAQLKWLQQARKMRNELKAKLLPEGKLENLPTALDSYESVIRQIVREVRRNGSEPILMAQAVQRLFMSDKERARLWMGVLNEGEGYVSEEQSPAILDQYNRRMGRVALDEHVSFIDLPAALELGAGPFYDGVHFNDRGAAQTAKVVANFFVERGLMP